MISPSYPSSDAAARPHPIDLPHTSRMYKTLLQGGHFSHASRTVERVPGWDTAAFAAGFVRAVGQEVTVAMCAQGEGNGAFVVAELCEALMRDSGSEERTTVKGWFGDAVRKAVEEGKAKGKKVLLDKVGIL